MTDTVVSPGATGTTGTVPNNITGALVVKNKFGQWRSNRYYTPDNGVTRTGLYSSDPLTAAQVQALTATGVTVEKSNVLFTIGNFEVTPVIAGVMLLIGWNFRPGKKKKRGKAKAK